MEETRHPHAFGAYIKGSFIFRIPYRVHDIAFIKESKDVENGIEAVDLYFKTVLSVARGEAMKTKPKKFPKIPTYNVSCNKPNNKANTKHNRLAKYAEYGNSFVL